MSVSQIPLPPVGEERAPRAQRVGRVRGNAECLTKRQLPPVDTATRSRVLRKEAGEPERRLWRGSREMLPDPKFRRQVPFGRYHAYFCSHAMKLITEIDGDDHALRANRDAARTRFLEGEGYREVRFGNRNVMENINGVTAAIAAAVIDMRKGRP